MTKHLRFTEMLLATAHKTDTVKIINVINHCTKLFIKTILYHPIISVSCSEIVDTSRL